MTRTFERKILLLFLGAFTALGVDAAGVLWGVFSVGTIFVPEGTSIYYYSSNPILSPEVGFAYNYNQTGLVIGLSPKLEYVNVGNNVTYWVIANYGDELATFSDFQKKRFVLDTGVKDIKSGDDISVPSHGAQFYIACFGLDNGYDGIDGPYDGTYYGWAEVKVTRTGGLEVLDSAYSYGMPIVVGTYSMVPEPTSGMVALLGVAIMLLRRKRAAAGFLLHDEVMCHD